MGSAPVSTPSIIWMAFREGEVWADLPADQMGRPPARGEGEAILGYGPEGA